MPADWNAAAAAIAGAFRDPTDIVYAHPLRGDTVIAAIRSDRAAPAFEGGPAKTARTIAYEIAYGLLPSRPKNGETFTHRRRIWQITNVTNLDAVGAWELVVTDAGAAA